MKKLWCCGSEIGVTGAEALNEKVRKLLSKAELVRKGGKILILVDGEKVGKLRFEAPLEELEVESAWKSPFGIKVELSWRGKFAGMLLLRE
ncbi:hypothetical protein [Thermococcus sp.]|uniref:hypothetical protein n=1 Tax=Thermococcus sp. TaxID=35749 RepID=UPI0025F76F12|nr:hypothetical protein [Thermococcus sp.]